MAEEKVKTEASKKEEEKMDEVNESKIEEKVEVKTETKKATKKKDIIVKEVAVANGLSLRISKKSAIAICKVIKGKSPQAAVKRLEDVLTEKRVIPMKNREVGHKKGKGLAGAKFPKNACKEIINLVKQIEANAVVAGIENPVITIAKTDGASRPFRRAGRQAKRAHVHLEVKDKTKLVKTKK